MIEIGSNLFLAIIAVAYACYLGWCRWLEYRGAGRIIDRDGQ